MSNDAVQKEIPQIQPAVPPSDELHQNVADQLSEVVGTKINPSSLRPPNEEGRLLNINVEGGISGKQSQKNWGDHLDDIGQRAGNEVRAITGESQVRTMPSSTPLEIKREKVGEQRAFQEERKAA
ncbi:MAG: hypothetical protein Q7S44_00325 [bacterium]|nr:hypothetical protein [bacterium]